MTHDSFGYYRNLPGIDPSGSDKKFPVPSDISASRRESPSEALKKGQTYMVLIFHVPFLALKRLGHWVNYEMN